MRLSCLASLFVCLAVSGCSGNKDAAPPRTDGKISIKGSNTVGEELGPQLIAEYKKEHPGAEFDLESKATGYGLAALLAGQCDIAAASRTPIKDELSLAQSRGVELNDYVIGSYSVAVVVNSNNPVADLTVAQVRDLFTGTIKNWKELGGPDAPVQLYVRDPISGTYLGFRELALDNKPYGAGLKTFTNYSGIVHAVSEDPNGIGYCSIELAAKGVKPISVQGTAPTIAAINQGKYPYTRTLRFYTAKSSEPAGAREFVQFAQSARGQKVLAETGNVPRQ
jgi:phosphate transport system substrate-binding protein